MRLPVDDALYRVDARYLGPKGWSLPWQARYASYGIGFLIFLATMAIVHRAIPFPASAVIALAVTVAATTLLSRRIDHERPARTVVQGFWSEVTAARPPAAVSTVVRAPKVRR
jgi:VIT1/CCC1 family predicted Fe2+/Mn2+ transporter